MRVFVKACVKVKGRWRKDVEFYSVALVPWCNEWGVAPPEEHTVRSRGYSRFSRTRVNLTTNLNGTSVAPQREFSCNPSSLIDSCCYVFFIHKES